MKTCIILCAAVAAYSARSAQFESPNVGAALPRGITLDYSRVPWIKPPAPAEKADLEVVVATVKDELGVALSGLAELNENLTNAYQNTSADAYGPGLLAADYSGFAAGNFSTLVSQNLSVQSSQLLSTSLAVPTALPWCPWGNGPGAVAVGTPGGPVVLPTYPPRTAWGNGPGIVSTTPGGAVFSMVASPQANGIAPTDSARLREFTSQLLALQDDVARLKAGLESLNLNPNAPGTFTPTPTYTYPPYLSPTGR